MKVTNNGLRKLSMADLHEAANRLKNWQRWGSDDEIGTLNHTRAEDIAAAARLVKKGKVISRWLCHMTAEDPKAARATIRRWGALTPST